MTTANPLPQPAPGRIARFGVFELDASSGELRRAGIRVPLQDQPVRLLAFLLERAGEVVTREDLHAALWPSEFVDFDHGLNTAIRKLRAALDDSADNPRFIETLARRGYRFIAPVAWDGAVAKPVIVPAKPRSLWPAALFAIVAVALVAAAIFVFRKPLPKRIDSIAVLPFINADRATQHINDGLTEILIDTLSHVPGLRVMAPTTVFRYKDARIDPKHAGEQLGVPAVITGRIREEGGRYTLRVEMIDVSDGAQLWARSYEGTDAELPPMQSLIASDLVAQLRGSITGAERHLIAERYKTTPEAYELYTRGLYAWNQRDPANLQRALDYFNAAIARDPKFAAAYAGLSKTYGVMTGYGLIASSEGAARVIEYAQKALDLDPDNAEAMVSIATTKYRSIWDFAGADADYQRGLKLNPSYATGHQWYSDYLQSMGRWDDARREIDIARELDPFSGPIATVKCFNLYRERRYREAIAFSRRMSDLDTRFASPICTAFSLLALNDVAGAAAELKAYGPHQLRGHAADVAAAFERGGRQAFFHKWIEDMQTENTHSIDVPVGIAVMYAQLGDRDRAFEWLNEAVERRVSIVTSINVEPTLDSLHDDPRWDALLRRIGLPKVQPPKIGP